jgi:chemotaxis protein MotB
MAGKGGGAWKVAYADFVTAMMAFFMVMWLTTQKEGVKEAVAGYFREPFATFKGTEKGAAATAVPVTDPKYGHTATPQKRRLSVSGEDIDYQFTVLFEVGAPQLEEGQQEMLKGIAASLAGKLNRVEIRSHCLRRPLPKESPYTDHWELCYAQCQVVKKELEALGIEPERIRLSQAEGNEPLALDLGRDELKLNSRVDVILLPDLADVPWRRHDRPGATAAPADDHGDAAPSDPGAPAPAEHGAPADASHTAALDRSR